MYAVRERATGRALYLFDREPTIDATGLHGEVRATDIRPETHDIVACDPPPSPWVGDGVWAYVGEAWSIPDQGRYDAALAAMQAAAPVPQRVTNFQARAALMAAGLFDQVDTALKTAGDPMALQAWEYANEVARGGALVNGLVASLGWTHAQLDDLFRVAALIEA